MFDGGGFMIISVEDKFDSLYNELKKRGYTVYKFSEHKVSDVVIYSGQSTRLTSLNTPEVSANDRGVLLINGDFQNIEQIENIIKNKTYSSLF